MVESFHSYLKNSQSFLGDYLKVGIEVQFGYVVPLTYIPCFSGVFRENPGFLTAFMRWKSPQEIILLVDDFDFLLFYDF